MVNSTPGIGVARRATVLICGQRREHRGQGLLLTLADETVVLTCHHVIAPIIESGILVQIPGDDGRLGEPRKATLDLKRSKPTKDAVVLLLEDYDATSSPLLHALNPATYAALTPAIGLTHLQPNNFSAKIGPSTHLVIKAPVIPSGFLEYQIPTAFRLVESTDARQGISGGVILCEGGVLGLVHFARGESVDTARECFLVPLSTWAEDWPELAVRIQPLVLSDIGLADRTDSQLALVVVPFQAPPLPTHYVERSSEVKAVMEQLFDTSQQESGVLVVSAVHGLAGIGKTALAAAIAHNPQTRSRFKDGVLWTVLGQEPDILPNLVEWIRALGDKDYRPTTISAAASYLRTLLYQKASLLVIDDVWQAEQAHPFLAGGIKCRAIITTRRAQVADDLGANLADLDVMSPEDALSLLKKRVQGGRKLQSVTNFDEAEAKSLARETGYLPLALEIMGALIARGYPWVEARRLLNLEATHKIGTGREHHAQIKLEASLQVSLKILRAEDPKAWECFVWLGVLPDDALLNPAMAATLWDVSEDTARQILISLADDAIIQRSFSYFMIHDLMHDLARRLLISPAPNGFGITTNAAHGLLLSRYASHIDAGEWHRLPNDSYIHSHLLWHLEKSGESESIHHLLSQSNADGRNAWFVARDQLGQSAGYLDDIRTGFRLNNDDDNFSIARQCQYGLVTASLHDLAESVSSDVLLLLVQRGIWSAEKALDHISRLSRTRRRGESLRALFRALTESPNADAIKSESARAGLINNILRETRNLVKRRPETSLWGAQMLAELAGHFEGDQQTELVQEAVLLVDDDFDLLVRLAKDVPANHRDAVLEIACQRGDQIADWETRIKSLAYLITSFPSHSWRLHWSATLRSWTEDLMKWEVSGAGDDSLAPSESPEPQTRAEQTQSMALIVYEGDFTPPPVKTKPHIEVIKYIAENRIERDWLKELVQQMPDGPDKTILEALLQESEPAKQETEPTEIDLHQQFFAAVSSRRLYPDDKTAIEVISQLSPPRLDYARTLLVDCNWPSTEYRGEVATRVAQFLTPEESSAIARELVANGRTSVGVRCLMAMTEEEPGRSKLINSVVTDLKTLGTFNDQEMAMRAIARTCPGEIVRKALVEYQHIDDLPEQAALIFGLTPSLKGEIPTELFERLADKTLTGKQIATLTRMVSKLSSALKEGVLAEFIMEASRLSSEWWIVEALTLTILRINEKDLLNTTLEAVKNITLPDLRSRIVGRLMLRYVRLGYMKEAFAAVDVAVPTDRPSILADLAEELAKDDLLAEAEKVSATINDREERSKAYANVALYTAARGNLEKAHALASLATSDHWNNWINMQLRTLNGIDKMPLLPESFRPAPPPEMIDGEGIKFGPICELLNDMLQEENEFPGLPNILSKAEAREADGTTTAVRQFWREKGPEGKTYLEIICERPRSRFLKELQRLQPLLNASLTREEAKELIWTVQTVSSWWP
jgi:hypothetical protein